MPGMRRRAFVSLFGVAASVAALQPGRDSGDRLSQQQVTRRHLAFIGRLSPRFSRWRPLISMGREFVELGGLMSYGADITDFFRRGATYVDKILLEVPSPPTSLLSSPPNLNYSSTPRSGSEIDRDLVRPSVHPR